MKVNSVHPFDSTLLSYDFIDVPNLSHTVKRLTQVYLTPDAEVEWLLRAIALIDLTTLAGDDTVSNVHRLCVKARYPLSKCIARILSVDRSWDLNNLRTAAVCVYPNQVKTCVQVFEQLRCTEFPIAAVATGFPSGQYGLNSRLLEIRDAIDAGATEIDIVINRTLALQHEWRAIYDEVCAMRAACGESAHLKTILATGELGSYENVYAASMVCMMAGADFIKTSTGKEAVNATLPISLVMARAIQDFHEATGTKVGFKPAGGLRTAQDAINYLALLLNYLGPEWTRPGLLRFGASSLLANIESRLYTLLTNGHPPAPGQLDFV